MREIAEETPEDAIQIVTKTGERIRRGALVSKKAVRINAFAKTVDHHHAWEEMGRYFDELVDSGRIEA